MENGKQANPDMAGEVTATQAVSPFPTSPAAENFRVRPPKIRDAKNFATAIANTDLSPEAAQLASGGDNEAAILLVFKEAMANPIAMDQMLTVVADLWEHEPNELELNADEPPEDWEYDPPTDMVESGNAIARDERWRSLSKRQKRRLLKKLDLEDLGVDVIPAFWEAMKELPYLKDFLASSESAEPDDTGSSSTSSATATGGQTSKRRKRSAPAPSA